MAYLDCFGGRRGFSGLGMILGDQTAEEAAMIQQVKDLRRQAETLRANAEVAPTPSVRISLLNHADGLDRAADGIETKIKAKVVTEVRSAQTGEVARHTSSNPDAVSTTAIRGSAPVSQPVQESLANKVAAIFGSNQGVLVQRPTAQEQVLALENQGKWPAWAPWALGVGALALLGGVAYAFGGKRRRRR